MTAFPKQAEALKNQSNEKPTFATRQRTPISRRSKERQRTDRIYNARVKVWLKLPANVLCHCCAARGLKPRPSSNCHHKHGRGYRDELKLVESLWVACCSSCHPQWIDANKNEAREIGMLAPAGQYNRMPI